MKDGPPIRVVVIGGGCAGMSCVWQLAKQSGYDIHVYEKSWKLGGKGASVRADDGRILEHGLHVWMGFYENAFRMMRECYEEVEAAGWGPDTKDRRKQKLTHGRFDDAFMPEPHVAVVDPDFHGESIVWSAFFPPNESQPGTPLEEGANPFTIASYMARCFDMTKALMLSIVGDMPGKTPGEPRPDMRSRSDEVLNVDIETSPRDSAGALLERMTELTRAGTLSGAAALLQLVTILEVWLQGQDLGPKSPRSTLALAEAAVGQARKLLHDLVSVDPQLRVKTEVVDIVLTVMIGLIRDRVMFREEGLDYINKWDYREWLKAHGATKTSLESRFLHGAYDFPFAYEDGDMTKPRLAAGVALRGAFRMFFTYRGAVFWRMRSGMGDAIFAPLYAVLNQRRRREHSPLKSPVTFHFLHELKALEFDRDGTSVSKLVFARTGDAGRFALDPNGCWPEQPAGTTPGSDLTLLRRDLRSGEQANFDAVIVATDVREFNEICIKGKNLNAKVARRWRAMSHVVKTTATKSAQVWLKRSLYDLGWRRGTGLFSAKGGKFDTYADMTHVLPAEARAGKLDPSIRSLAYFCSPMAEAVVAEESKTAGDDRKLLKAALDNRVRSDLGELLKGEMSDFWPELNLGDDVAHQHAQANAEGSERYTQSLPGSLEARISPLDLFIDNMTVAGDWTACGLDCGCVEAAVMSGMLAAASISGRPELEDIVGYDHP